MHTDTHTHVINGVFGVCVGGRKTRSRLPVTISQLISLNTMIRSLCMCEVAVTVSNSLGLGPGGPDPEQIWTRNSDHDQEVLTVSLVLQHFCMCSVVFCTRQQY